MNFWYIGFKLFRIHFNCTHNAIIILIQFICRIRQILFDSAVIYRKLNIESHMCVQQQMLLKYLGWSRSERTNRTRKRLRSLITFWIILNINMGPLHDNDQLHCMFVTILPIIQLSSAPLCRAYMLLANIYNNVQNVYTYEYNSETYIRHAPQSYINIFIDLSIYD